MQNPTWSASTADQQNNFNNTFFGADANNGGLSMSQEAVNSLYSQPAPEDMTSVFNQYNNSSHNLFSQPSHMIMSQLPEGNLGENDASGSGQHYSSQMMNNIDAAAYGHLGYPGGANPSRSHQQQKDMFQHDSSNIWPPQQMNGYSHITFGTGPMPLRPHGSFNGSQTGAQLPNSVETPDAANNKRRRMTMTNSVAQVLRNSGASVPLHDDGNAVQAQMQAYQNIAGNAVTRPPFRHRRSRSGSEVTGQPSKPHSFGSFDAGSASHNHHSDNGFVPTNSMYPPSFPSIQSSPSAAGHAASHPPGLGNRMLRGVDVSASGSSAATDFTKRKGWTGRVVEELLDFVHVLDPEGTILFASPSVHGLTGWKSEELKGRKLSEFVHPQDVVSVEREIDRMRSGQSELLTYYRFKTKNASHGKTAKSGTDNDSSATDTAEDKHTEHRSEVEHADAFTRDGDYIVFEATGHPYFPPEPVTVPSNGTTDGRQTVMTPTNDDLDNARVKSESLSTAPSDTGSQTLSQTPTSEATSASSSARTPLQCFFCSARPYPSKNTSMLDSFLELKLENEKLRLMIADLDLGGQDQDVDRSQQGAAYHADAFKQESDPDASSTWPTPNPPYSSKMGSTDGSTGNAAGPRTSNQFSRNNSFDSHPPSPAMRSGSRHEDLAGLGVSNIDESDEESNNLTTPAVGSIDSERRKKPKQDDGDHVCTDCGRVDSPEWRKGPLGPKTLCNACGLRWAKKVKRKGGDLNMLTGPGSTMQQPMSTPLNHQHPFGHADSGLLQGGVPMAPSGSTSNMSNRNMAGMVTSSTPTFTSMPSFDDGSGHR